MIAIIINIVDDQRELRVDIGNVESGNVTEDERILAKTIQQYNKKFIDANFEAIKKIIKRFEVNNDKT